MSRSVSAEMHTLLECHVELDLEGYEDKNIETGECFNTLNYNQDLKERIADKTSNDHDTLQRFTQIVNLFTYPVPTETEEDNRFKNLAFNT